MENVSSCIFCETYYGNGKMVEFSVMGSETTDKFIAESHNWKLVYEFGEGDIIHKN